MALLLRAPPPPALLRTACLPMALLALGPRVPGQVATVATTPMADVVWEAVAETPADRFGAALAAVGDVDGDDVGDLLVGAPSAGTLTGRVSLRSGQDGTELWGLPGQGPYDALGTAVAGLGDLDGDGVPDVAVGAPAGNPPSGHVRILSGVAGAPLLMLTGDAAGDRFGAALAGLGDVDGDGQPDLVVGAPQADGPGPSSGRASVFAAVDGVRIHAWEGQAFDHLGRAVAGPGDVDGDGRADVLVGAPLSDGVAFNGGGAFLFSGRDGSLLAAHHGGTTGDQLGTWLAGVGDLDGDGTPDLALGAPGSDQGALDAGAVELRSGATGALLFTVLGEEMGDGLGVVAGCGDVDRDGVPDVAVGAPTAKAHAGCVRVVSGATGLDLARREGDRPFEWFGASLAGPGDGDGDGRSEVAAGAPVHDDRLAKAGRVRWIRP